MSAAQDLQSADRVSFGDMAYDDVYFQSGYIVSGMLVTPEPTSMHVTRFGGCFPKTRGRLEMFLPASIFGLPPDVELRLEGHDDGSLDGGVSSFVRWTVDVPSGGEWGEWEVGGGSGALHTWVRTVLAPPGITCSSDPEFRDAFVELETSGTDNSIQVFLHRFIQYADSRTDRERTALKIAQNISFHAQATEPIDLRRPAHVVAVRLTEANVCQRVPGPAISVAGTVVLNRPVRATDLPSGGLPISMRVEGDGAHAADLRLRPDEPQRVIAVSRDRLPFVVEIPADFAPGTVTVTASSAPEGQPSTDEHSARLAVAQGIGRFGCAAPRAYQLIPLRDLVRPDPCPPATDCWLTSINAVGDVLGVRAGRPFRQLLGGRVDYLDEALHARAARAYALNSNGHVAGIAFTDSGKANGFIYGEPADLDNNGSVLVTDAAFTAISDRGDAAGFRVQGGRPHALLWRSGRLIDIEPAGAKTSAATAVNAAGTVVGWWQTLDGEERAFIYEDGTSKDLGDFGGTNTVALHLNDRGTVVGVARTDTGASRTFLYHEGEFSDLGKLGRFEHHEPSGLDNNGVVVGMAYTSKGRRANKRAFRWSEGNGLEELDRLKGTSRATVRRTIAITRGGDILIELASKAKSGSKVALMRPNRRGRA